MSQSPGSTPVQSAAGSGDIYRDLLEAVVDYAIYRLDVNGQVLSWNAGAQNIKGFRADEAVGQNFSRFFTDEDRAAGAPEAVLAAARSKGRHEVEGWRVRRDGTRFWALAVIDAIYGEDGSIIGFAKITRDMTERRAAQRALEESERQFRLLVAGVSDYAIYMIDPTGIVSSWNAGAERIKGYGADEIIGNHFSRFYTAEDLAAGMPRVALDTARATGRYEAEGWRLRKDGSRFWANVVIDAIRDETGTLIGFAKITRDITERRDNQLRLEEAREQLLQAQKMESIGQLTGGVAHDFNNLLTVILGGVNLAKRRLDQPERVMALLDNVAEAAERGASLTKQLLAFSRRQSLDPEAIDLQSMLPGFVDLLDRALGGAIEISLSVAEGCRVMADLRQLELALLNVGLNARDAMGEGGRITITAEHRRLDEPNSGLTGDFIAISLADTGSGMTAELCERVFEPFFTTKEVGRGTGLGLSQAYGFAQQSGGSVRIASEPGQGTTVTFLLPDAGEAISPVRTAQLEGGGDFTGRRILVVEDEASVASITCALLEEAGAEVIRAENVSAALAAVDTTPFDLVFSDVVMPGGRSGFDLARQLAQDWPNLPVVLATGYSGGVKPPASAEIAILSKPYESAELFRVIAEVIGAPRPA